MRGSDEFIFHFPFIIFHFSFGLAVVGRQMKNEKWKMTNRKWVLDL